jgi:tetratricopeptide (TPR) repeat protein/O-antigen ligase
LKGLNVVGIQAKSSSSAYWKSFFIFLTGAVYLTLLGGYTWRGSFNLQLAGLVLGTAGLAAFIIWRGVIHHSRLSRTGLDVIFGFGLLGLLLSLVFSPAPGEGFWQAASLIGYALLFFILLEGFSAGLDRQAALDAILWVSGIAIALAVSETYQWYASWWAVGGGSAALPPYQYRFIGILFSSIPLVGLANLAAPLALYGFLKDKSRLPRILKGVWLMLYALALPFSSSRAGWLGALVWAGILLGFWVVDARRKVRINWGLFSRRKWVAIALAGCLGLLLLVVGGRWFLFTFASSPTHGINPVGDSGRSVFWANSLAIWTSSPLVGTGPGRFGFAYLAVAPNTLPGFWPLHAHNTYLQPLVSFGMLGFAAFLALLIWGFKSTWKNFQSLPVGEKFCGKAVLAGLGSLLVQMFFEDYTGWISVVSLAIVMVAWLWTSADNPLRRWQRLSVNWLAIPGLALIALAGWGLWAYQPAAAAAGGLTNANWAQAARLFDQSTRRAATFSLYPGEAGIAWANAWRADHAPAELEQARQAFQKALKIEGFYSPWWADLSVLDWYAGDQPAAIADIQKAAQLSPQVPDYPLLLGWYAEQMNSVEMAKKEYGRVLTLAPGWASHPFWQINLLRNGVLAGWQKNQPDPQASSPSFWQKTRDAIKHGNLEEARRDLAYSRLLGEPSLPQLVSEGQLALANGDHAQARQSFSQVVELMAWNDYPAGQVQAFFLERFMFNHNGLGSSYVPGYMALSADVGQFQAAEWLYSDYLEAGDCQEAQKTWQLLQKARMGLTLDPVAPPKCEK